MMGYPLDRLSKFRPNLREAPPGFNQNR